MEQWTGVLQLTVQRKQERTVLAEVYNQGASKVTPPIYLDDSGLPCFYMLNLGGGYVDGDRYKTDIHLCDDAHMLLTTQSSTKIYKTLKVPVLHEMDIRLEQGSYLEFISDPLIAYRHARYKQETVVRMARGATLVYGEIITPGWSPDGALFQYNRLQLRTVVYIEDELVVFDNLPLTPETRSMEGLGLLEGYTHLGSLLVIGDNVPRGMAETLGEELEAAGHLCRVGISALAVSGFSLRVLAMSTLQIENVFEQCRRVVRERFLGSKTVSFRKY
ncbi:urease accessory protein UreD [Paenibacillus sp. YSY-4.3]